MHSGQAVEIVTFRAPGLIPSLLSAIQGEAEPVILVPQSFTLAAEQAILRRNESRGMLGNSVFSPRSLIREIRERAGLGAARPLTPEGRVMLLSRLLLEHEKDLRFYQGSVHQTGLAKKLAEQIDEFRDAGLQPEMLEQFDTHGATRRKFADLQLLWSAYEDWCEKGFLDDGALWQKALTRLGASGLLQGAHLLIYGFDHLTAELTSLIQSAFSDARRITVGLICDDLSPDAPIFTSTRRSIQRFAETSGIPCAVRVFPWQLDAAPGIRYAESSLYSPAGPASAPADLNGLTLYTGRSSAQECAYIAQTLLQWHRNGMRWADMGVALCETETLPRLLAQTLRAANIPYTVRIGRNMMVTGLAVFFRSLLRAMTLRWPQEDMLTLFRSGWPGLNEDDQMAMENYALAHGVTRTRWLRPFPEEDETVLRLEAARKHAMDQLTSLRQTLANRSCKGKQAATLLYHWLIDQGIYDRLLKEEQELLASGQPEQIDLNRQAWSGLLEMLDQLATFAGDQHLPLADLTAMLDSALSGRQIKQLPQSADTVTVSKPSMFLSDGYRGMIVAGFQQPGIPGAQGLLTERERSALRELNFSMGFTRDELASRMKQDVYQAVSLAREQLLISCSLSRPNGSILYAAQPFKTLAAALRAAHPEQVRGGVQQDELLPYSPGFALENLAIRLRDARDYSPSFLTEDSEDARAWRNALQALYHRKEWRGPLLTALTGLHLSARPTGIRREQAEQLYPRSLSPSFAETAAACLCMNWAQRGLALKERPVFDFAADQQGTFTHEILNRYFEAAMADPDWPRLSPERIEQILNRLLRPATAPWRDGPLGADTVHRYQGAGLIRNVRTMCRMLTEAMQQTPHFRPVAMEAGFGVYGNQRFPAIQLRTPEGRDITLSGVIDRIDTLELPDGRRYLLVTDYKRSAKETRWSDLRSGVTLQLPLYLLAATRGMPDYEPAGGVYQPIREIVVDAAPEAMRAEMSKAARSQGIVLADETVQAAMSPLKLAKKSGDLIPSMNPEEIRSLLTEALETTGRLVDLQLDGQTAPSPVRDPSVCEYCMIRHACEHGGA